MLKISGSIVLYKNDRTVLLEAINSFLRSKIVNTLFLVDNSPDNSLADIVESTRVVYIHNPSNPGFGEAHNLAIKKSIDAGAKFHFVINPDVFFNADVVSKMVEYMSNNKRVGMMMPQILNLDGTVQNLPKLMPSPLSVVLRKLRRPKFFYKRFIKKYELRDVPQTKIYEAPILSGCFTLLNLEAIKEVGGYDDKYFMYFEDWDLSRRVNEKFKTIYYPYASIYHGYESGANRDRKLFQIFLKSAILYFNKWGWIYDKDRRLLNKKTLDQFR